MSPPQSIDAVALAKSALRARMKAVGVALPSDTRSAAAHALWPMLDATFAGAPGVVASYAAIGDELDPSALEARLRERGHTIALPLMAGRADPLVFRRHRPGDPLVHRAWGIAEPIATAPALVPEIVLVPLLAFDSRGHRLGYGGGYYDRTLAALRQHGRVIAIGLAFDAQQVDAVPHLDYDQRLDFIATPSAFIATS